jgi:hypothetical protein
MTTTPATILIGLVGPAGAGKDTTAQILAESWRQDGIACSVLAFAEPIKRMTVAFLQSFDLEDPEAYVVNRDLKEAVIPEIGVSARHIMQTLGTEWGQQCIGRSVWIKSMHQSMLGFMARGCQHFVITDVRFEHEADWVRSQGGMIWRIERPHVAPVRAHASESGLSRIRSDVLIVNDGTFDDLRAAVGFELAKLRYERI